MKTGLRGDATSRGTPNAVRTGAPGLRRLVQSVQAAGQRASVFATKRPLATCCIYVGIIVVLTVLAGMPLLHLKLLSGPDSGFYIPRDVEFFQGLKAGELFPRWAPDLAAGYGEPTFNFNPPLLSYIVAGFHALGTSFVAGEDLTIFALLLLSGVGMYALAREFFGDLGGLVAATAYLFIPFRLTILYHDHMLADSSAFPFVPLAFWGLYRFTRDGHYRFLLVGSVSIACIFLTSSSLSLISFPALCLFVGWLTWQNRSTLSASRGAVCLAFGLAIPAFFWLPALTETNFVHIGRRIKWIDYHDNFLQLSQFFVGKWGRADIAESFAMSAAHVALLAAALILFPRIWRRFRPAGVLVSFFLVLILVTGFLCIHASLFLWERLAVLQPLQFQWRFLALVSLGTAFLCGAPFVLFGENRRWLATTVAGAAVVALVGFGLPHAEARGYGADSLAYGRPGTARFVYSGEEWAQRAFPVTKDADFTPDKIAAEGLWATAREFEPVWVEQFPWPPRAERVTFLSGGGKMLTGNFAPSHYNLNVLVTKADRVRVNTFYFPDWTLRVDGRERDFDISEPNGLMEFNLEPGSHRVQLDLRDTPIRIWATYLSLATLLLLISWPWLTRLPVGQMVGRFKPRNRHK